MGEEEGREGRERDSSSLHAKQKHSFPSSFNGGGGAFIWLKEEEEEEEEEEGWDAVTISCRGISKAKNIYIQTVREGDRRLGVSDSSRG